MVVSEIALSDFEQLFKKGKVVFFAGSGICYASGLPTATDILIRTVECALPPLEEEKLEIIKDGILPEVFYETLLSLVDPNQDQGALSLWSSLSQLTQLKFEVTVQPNIVHSAIMKNALEFSNPVFTVNFDTLFEQVLEDVVVYDPKNNGDVLCLDTNRVKLVKLHGCIDNDSILFTISSISRINNLLKIFINALQDKDKYLCIVGYSGRDVDIFPTIEKYGISERRVIWINKFDDDRHSRAASLRCHARRIEKYPSEVFDEILDDDFKTVKANLDSVLDSLQEQLDQALDFNDKVRQLTYGILLGKMGRHAQANAILKRLVDISEQGNCFFTYRQQAELYLATIRSYHEVAAYSDCLHLVQHMIKWAAQRQSDVDPKLKYSTRIRALSNKAQALGMHIPINTYFWDPFFRIIFLVVVSIATFYSVIYMRILVYLAGGIDNISLNAQQELLETRIRIVGTLQDTVAPVVNAVTGSVFKKTINSCLKKIWIKIFDKCGTRSVGYAAGLANVYKFLERIDPDAAHEHADQHKAIYVLLTDSTGDTLILRNEADKKKTEGAFDEAICAYIKMKNKASESGAVLNEVKALLGIADTRRLSQNGAMLGCEELRELDELSKKVQGRIWKLYLTLLKRYFGKQLRRQ